MQTVGEVPPPSNDSDSNISPAHKARRNSIEPPKLSSNLLENGTGESSEPLHENDVDIPQTPPTLNCSLASSEKGSLRASAEISRTADIGQPGGEMHRRSAEVSHRGSFYAGFSSPKEAAGLLCDDAALETSHKEPRSPNDGRVKSNSPSRSRRITPEKDERQREPVCHHKAPIRTSLKEVKSHAAQRASDQAAQHESGRDSAAKSTAKTRKPSSGGTSRSVRNSSVEPITDLSGYSSKRPSVDVVHHRNVGTGKYSSHSEDKTKHSLKYSQEVVAVKGRLSAELSPHKKEHAKPLLHVAAENELKSKTSTTSVSTLKSKRKTKKNQEQSEKEAQDETSKPVQEQLQPHIHVYLFTDCDRASPNKNFELNSRKTLPQQGGLKPSITNPQQSSGIVTFKAQKSPCSTSCSNQPKDLSTGALAPSHCQTVPQNQSTMQAMGASTSASPSGVSGSTWHIPESLNGSAKSLKSEIGASYINRFLLQQPTFGRHTYGILSAPVHSTSQMQPGVHLHIAQCSSGQASHQGGTIGADKASGAGSSATVAANQEAQHSRSWAAASSTEDTSKSPPPELFFSFLSGQKWSNAPELAHGAVSASNASMSVCCGGYHFTVSDHVDRVPRLA